MYFFFLRPEIILWWATLASGKVLNLCLLHLYFVKLLESSKIEIGGKGAGAMQYFGGFFHCIFADLV